MRYTLDYSERGHSAPSKPGTRTVSRIREAFSWTSEHDIDLKSLPEELTKIRANPSCSNGHTEFYCSKRFIQCEFFPNPQCSPPQIPVERPTPVTFTTAEVIKLNSKLVAASNCTSPKRSKSAKKKLNRKKLITAKMEEQLKKEQTPLPLNPGMGRGFSQRLSTQKFYHMKPLAVISPIKRSEDQDQDMPLEVVRMKCGPKVGRGRGISMLGDEIVKNLWKSL